LGPRHFDDMSSVRSTSDGRGPVTRKRVPDREEAGKPRKDARRGRCHPLEAGFWPLWMTPLQRTTITEYRIQGRLRSWSGPVETDFQGRLRFSYANRPGIVMSQSQGVTSIESRWIKETLLTMRTLRVARS